MAAPAELIVVWSNDGRAFAVQHIVPVPVWDNPALAGQLLKLVVGDRPAGTVDVGVN